MRKKLKYTALAILAGVLCFALYLGIQLSVGNFHKVVKGEFYRSAQLEPGDLTIYKRKYEIASVINLRGTNKGEHWYDDEVREAKSLGVKHIDFPMKASRELTKEQAIELIAIMRDAPKPLLIHCRSGADRTGLAAAFYVAAIAKGGEWAAERQLWLNYGHLPFWINESYAMNRTFERLEPYFGFDGS